MVYLSRSSLNLAVVVKDILFFPTVSDQFAQLYEIKKIIVFYILRLKVSAGRAMAQAVIRRPLNAEARVRSRGQSMWDLWWTKWHWDRFSPRVLRFSPVNFIPPVLHYKEKRKKLMIFITGLHNKPQGCGASVASAAGHCTQKKKVSTRDGKTRNIV
jgi:hypothetical protein